MARCSVAPCSHPLVVGFCVSDRIDVARSGTSLVCLRSHSCKLRSAHAPSKCMQSTLKNAHLPKPQTFAHCRGNATNAVHGDGRREIYGICMLSRCCRKRKRHTHIRPYFFVLNLVVQFDDEICLLYKKCNPVPLRTWLWCADPAARGNSVSFRCLLRRNDASFRA